MTSSAATFAMTTVLMSARRFWVLLVHPRIDGADEEEEEDAVAAEKCQSVNVKVQDDVPTQVSSASFMQRLRDVPPLLKFIVPLGTVYLFEYFINQGLVRALTNKSFI